MVVAWVRGDTIKFGSPCRVVWHVGAGGEDRGQRVRQKTEDGRQKTVDRRPVADRRPQTGDRRQHTEDRRPKTDHSTQNTEHRAQNTEHRTQGTGGHMRRPALTLTVGRRPLDGRGAITHHRGFGAICLVASFNRTVFALDGRRGHPFVQRPSHDLGCARAGKKQGSTACNGLDNTRQDFLHLYR